MIEFLDVISLQPGFPDYLILISVNFWLWGYLKDDVISISITLLAEFNALIVQHILGVTQETQRSGVEYMLFLDFYFLQRTVDSIWNMLCTNLAKLKTKFMYAFHAVSGLRTI